MRKHLLYIYLAVGAAFVACESTDFDDPSTLTNEEAAREIKSFSYALVTSSVQTAFQTSTSVAGVHFSLLADQTTSTNTNSNWYQYAQEPRNRIINTSSAAAYSASINAFYEDFYQANLDATKVIDLIEKNSIPAYDNDGKDRSEDCLIGAYYAKGIAQGYLGAIYDRGIIVDRADLEERGFPNSYRQLIENGVSLLDHAIELAQHSSNFNFDFLVGTPLEKDVFLKLANSMAARLLASIARDKEEAQQLGADYWRRVENYAEQGFTTDFTIVTVSGGYWNEHSTRQTYVNNGGAKFLPVDVKVVHLADATGTYPESYPLGTTILDPVVTNDQRFDKYFGYTTNFGILMESRGRDLFTNYYRLRWRNDANTLNTPGAVNPYFLADETRFLRSEARLFRGDYSGAAALLNEPSARRKSIGQLPDVEPTEEAVRAALHYEYSVEIDDGGGVTLPFAFMRRNDLLQGGTPTEYPVPQEQLEIVGLDDYTFGGKGYEGERGIFGELATARDNGWKKSK